MHKRHDIMCTVTLNINEAQVRRINPALTDMDAITRWVQQLVNRSIAYLDEEGTASDAKPRSLSPNARSREEMKAIVERRLLLMESGQATYTDGEEGFAQIRARYGL